MFKKILEFFSALAPAANRVSPDKVKGLYNRLRWSVFLSATLGYGMFYVCRLSLSVIKKPMVDAGILTEKDLGIVGSARFFSYAVEKLANGFLADRWIGFNVRGRIYTGAIGLSLMIPALLLLGMGQGFAGIIGGGVLFGIGFGMFDANNMPILCQFVSPRHRAAGYGLMNLTGVFAGAFVTELLGKSTDSGNLGRDMAMLAIPVAAAVLLQLLVLKPTTANKEND